MEHGFFHADPHPSNIYVLDRDVLCYLDFGMMGVLDEDFRQDLAELFIYLMDTNVKGTVSKLQEMGIIDEYVDARSLKYDLTDLLFKYYGTELNQVHGGLDDLLRLMRKYRATLPRELVSWPGGIGMVEETGGRLDPTFNAVEIAQPLVRKTARKRLSPLNFLDYLKKNMFEMEHAMKNVPVSITRTLYKLEKGDIQIKVEHTGLERSTNKLSMSLVLAALLIGSSLIMTTDNGIFLLKFPYLGVVGFIISAILAAGLVVSIIRDRGI